MHPRAHEIVDAVRSWANRNEPRSNLLLLGPCGTGKDHLAMAACLYLICKHKQRCERVECAEWYARLRDGIDEGQPEARQLDAMAEPDVLLLSDPAVNGEPASAFQADWLYRVANTRDVRSRRTIVTLNVPIGRDTANECRRLIGAPAWDRLADGATIVRCNWRSYRRPEVVV